MPPYNKYVVYLCTFLGSSSFVPSWCGVKPSFLYIRGNYTGFYSPVLLFSVNNFLTKIFDPIDTCATSIFQ